jgi:transcriptional regulator NrdR family protein
MVNIQKSVTCPNCESEKTEVVFYNETSDGTCFFVGYNCNHCTVEFTIYKDWITGESWEIVT